MREEREKREKAKAQIAEELRKREGAEKKEADAAKKLHEMEVT